MSLRALLFLVVVATAVGLSRHASTGAKLITKARSLEEIDGSFEEDDTWFPFSSLCQKGDDVVEPGKPVSSLVATSDSGPFIITVVFKPFSHLSEDALGNGYRTDGLWSLFKYEHLRSTRLTIRTQETRDCRSGNSITQFVFVGTQSGDPVRATLETDTKGGSAHLLVKYSGSDINAVHSKEATSARYALRLNLRASEEGNNIGYQVQSKSLKVNNKEVDLEYYEMATVKTIGRLRTKLSYE